MYWILSLTAAVCYTVGGVFMKLSQGLSRPGPSLLVFLFFLTGAALQALAMRHAELGVAYLLVLGIESVLAFGLGVMLFGERPTPAKLAGVALVVLGMVLLHLPVGGQIGVNPIPAGDAGLKKSENP